MKSTTKFLLLLLVGIFVTASVFAQQTRKVAPNKQQMLSNNGVTKTTMVKSPVVSNPNAIQAPALVKQEGPAPISHDLIRNYTQSVLKPEYTYNQKDYPTPDVGGDLISSATVIGALPYTDGGNTCGFANDYNEDCPYTGSTSPDVVYAFTAGSNMNLTIDLCASLYDTKVFVYDNAYTPGTPYACNDDAGCGITGWQSKISPMAVVAGHTYYIVVDGYGGDCGDYTILVEQVADCIVDCPPGGILENEADIPDEGVDFTNGGCNSTPFVFSPISLGQTICGKANTYMYAGSQYRDTDWYRLDLSGSSTPYILTWTARAEFDLIIFMVNAGTENCSDYTILGNASAGPCVDATLTFTVAPGIYWVLVMPSVFTGYPASTGPHDYAATLTGTPTGGLTNDNCANAIAINEVTDLAFNTSTATPDGPSACNAAGLNIWYNYTATQTGVLTVDLCGSTYDTYLGIYDGFTCLGTNVACNDDACGLQSSITGIAVTAGQQYKIEVSGYSTNSGAGDLTVSVATGSGPANDLCVNAELVTGPYPETHTGTFVGATIDCAGVLDWTAVWYEVTLPYATNDLTVDFCGTNATPGDSYGIVYYNACNDCPNYVLATSYDFTTCGTPENITMHFDGIVGPGTIFFPAYINEAIPFTVTFDVVDAGGPCVVTCPVGSIPENEADILDEGYDVTNGGCNSSPFVFSPINLGDTYCGHANTYMFAGSQYRDTDWYRLDLSASTDWYQLTWAVEAEFPVIIFMVDANSEDCADYAILGNTTGNECTPISLTATVEPGVYWVLVMPSVFTGLPAGGDWVYTAELTGVPVVPTYCIVSATCDEYISNVTLNTINNSSACGAGGYTDYTAISTELIPGNAYDITITNGLVYNGDDIVGWIDWNQDLVFDPSEQIFCELAGDGQGTFNFTVPATALPGDTRMRVRMSYYAVDCNTMCGSQTYGETEDYTIHIPLAGITLDVKAFLEGPYNAAADNMNIFLNTTGVIPMTQPYNPVLPYYGNPAPAWLYAGTETFGVVPPTMVDWVLVEIRDAVDGISATSATMEARLACVLNSDGTIVDASTGNPPVVNVTIDNGLFVVLWHRNHLAVMNAAPIVGGPTYTYDFTTGSGQVYGGTLGCKQIDASPIVWGLMAADGNADKQVNTADKLNVWKPESGASGYRGGDFNLDSQVNTQDKLNVWKPNSGKASQVPN